MTDKKKKTREEVAAMYERYLSLSKLDVNKMHRIQKTGTERAFYAGVGSLLVTVLDEYQHTSPDDFILTLDNMVKELGFFFMTQSNQN